MFKIPGKIPVTISTFFLMVAFLIGWLNTSSLNSTLIWMGIIFVSVIVHEFGHALTAAAFGQKVDIELVAFGGVTKRRGGGKLKLWQEFMIVINGPLAGLGLAALAWILLKKIPISQSNSIFYYAVFVTMNINIVWTILNLIPVQPLDGGKLLSILLQSVFGVKGTKIALFISLLLAASFAVLFFVFKQYFVGSLFMLFTFESYKSWTESLAVTENDQSEVLQELLKQADREIRIGNQDEALNIFLQLREMSKAGIIFQTATENAAHLMAEKGDLKKAYETLSTLGKKLTPEGINLLHQLAYTQKKWGQAISLGDMAYHNHPTYQTAMINAASHASLGNVKPAIGWIQCAIQDGVSQLPQLLAKHEFDAIRNDPEFRKLELL